MWPSVEVEEDRQRCEVGREMAALQKSVEQCLGLGVSRWSRTGRAGPGCPWLLTVLRDCARGRFGAVSALELRDRFTSHFHRL